jgi:ABC-type multidrug transport system ATPase subunit
VEISLKDCGKKFYREWIFRHTSITFSGNQKTVIIGPNGSGKSTLLQVIAGATMLTEGKVRYIKNNVEIEENNIYKEISLAAPYLELIEEFTLKEVIKYHHRLKPSLPGLTVESMLELTGLANKADNIVKFFSSGMKQRVKLSLALLTDTPLLFLDEPCSNLDRDGVAWYSQMVTRYAGDRIVIVASNQHEEEYFFCTEKLHMSDFKS